VRDGNGQGTTGASQLLATLAGPDGRFRLGLQPRVPDLSAYFVYQNARDLIDLFSKAASGEVSGTVDTQVTQDGGTTPAEVRMVLYSASPPGTPPPPTPTRAGPPCGSTPTATIVDPAATPTPVFPGREPQPVPTAGPFRLYAPLFDRWDCLSFPTPTPFRAPTPTPFLVSPG
jgi:hypothetical protein